MNSNIQECFVKLFEDAQIQTKNFNRQSYEESFEAFYKKNKELLITLNQLMEETPDKEVFVSELSCVLPDYVKEKLTGIEKKSKRSNLVMDYNLALVTYVLPVINYGRDDNYKMISDAIVKKWNQEVAKTAVKNASFEQISGGFKNRLCYITTAVCESLGKPDDCYELELLRSYRDDYLIGENAGREIVQEYYNIAPTIVKKINRQDDAKEIYKGIWSEYLVPCIRHIERQELSDCKEVYSNMVYNLQKKYVYS